MAPALDPTAEAILEVIAASGAGHLSALGVEEARAGTRASLVTRGAPVPLHSVEDREVPTPHGPRTLRLYRPSPSGPLPVALFFHGGGWTLNDLDTHDELCRRLAKRSGWLLASLDYRLAPEHRHPAPLEDAVLAYRWLLDNADELGADASRRALVGESSGATIAASLALLLRDAGAPAPGFQLLAYPATERLDHHDSYREHAEGYILDRELMRWYFDNYLDAPADPTTPYLLPLAAGSLAGLPPAYVLTAEYDPLRDDGLAYVRRLRDDGVAVEHVHADDQMHGFLLLGRVVPRAAALIDQAGAALAAAGRARSG